MLTLKQVEAVYWVSVFGSFRAAAERLNTTQSTISKRIHELEKSLDIEVFDRTGKSTQLTIKGRELIDDFARMLELRHDVIRRVGSDSSYAGRFRFGVTEMVALTWLPALVAAIKQVYPQIILEPKVDLSVNLRQQIGAHRLDLMIGPVPEVETEFTVLPLGVLESDWMCSPRLIGPRKGVIPIEEILRFPLLTYAEGSLLYLRLLRAIASLDMRAQNTITCNSMIALAELASAGMGVAYLPRDYFSTYRAAGDLYTVQTGLTLPPLEYVVVYRSDSVTARIAELARQTCDFGPPRWRNGAETAAAAR